MKCLIFLPSQEAEPARDGSITAVALYDYQAMAEDEISFDPNDIITNIEMVGSFTSYGGLHNIRGFTCSFLNVICPMSQYNMSILSRLTRVGG